MNPLAHRLAGLIKASSRSGRKQGEHSPAYGPMSIARALLVLLLCFALLPVQAQQPSAPAIESETPTEQPAARPEWRNTDAYPLPALARTVADMQNLAHAMQLREFCANTRVPDDFVRERLDRFGAITGRVESCSSLLDY